MHAPANYVSLDYIVHPYTQIATTTDDPEGDWASFAPDALPSQPSTFSRDCQRLWTSLCRGAVDFNPVPSRRIGDLAAIRIHSLTHYAPQRTLQMTDCGYSQTVVSRLGVAYIHLLSL